MGMDMGLSRERDERKDEREKLRDKYMKRETNKYWEKQSPGSGDSAYQNKNTFFIPFPHFFQWTCEQKHLLPRIENTIFIRFCATVLNNRDKCRYSITETSFCACACKAHDVQNTSSISVQSVKW